MNAGRRARGVARQSGAAVVDFVLVMALLLPLVMGLLQLALVLHVRNVLSSAAAEGARVAATLEGGPGAGSRVTRSQITGSLGNEYAQQVEVVPTTVDGAPGYRVNVRAEVPALGLGGPSITVEVSGTAVREQP